MLKLKKEYKAMAIDDVIEELFWQDIYPRWHDDGEIYLIDVKNQIVYSTYCHFMETVFQSTEFYPVDNELKKEVMDMFHGD